MNHQKQIEDDLRKEKDFAETLINIAQIIIVVIDRTGKIIRFNSLMEKLSGYSLEEVKDQDWFTLFFRESDREENRRSFLESKSSYSYHLSPIVLKDGSIREIEWYKSKSKSRNGKCQFIIIGLDITERIQTQKAMLRQNARTTALLKNASRLNDQLNLDVLVKLLCEDISEIIQTKVSATFFEKKTDGLHLVFGHGISLKDLDVDPVPPIIYQKLIKQKYLTFSASELRSRKILSNLAETEPDLQAIDVIVFFNSIHLLGTINIYAYEETHLSEEDRNLLRGIADQAGMAVANALLFDQVKVTQKQLRKLNAKIIATQEEERKRLSRELHDETGQSLTALKICLVLLNNDIPVQYSFLKEKLSNAIMMVDTTLENLRTLAHQLRPPALKDNGINLVLEDLCRDFSKQSGLSIDYHGSELRNIPEEVSVCLYRILQESLTNIAKHAGASKVRIRLHQNDQQIQLSVQDNGLGLKKERLLRHPESPGIGLVGMAERLEMLGGRLEVRSKSGKGTQLVAWIPCGNRQPLIIR
jgi:PAS domain S-box-containing protein